MANAEHLAIFEQGVAAWNQWRRKNRGVTPDLSGAELKRANFRYANLNDANLERADLEGANLGRAYLAGAGLTGSSQRGAHFFRADLSHADLSHADLSEAQLWNAHLEHANLRDAKLAGADLRSCDLTCADLRDTDLGAANLSCANLLRTDLRNARLTGTYLHGARFSDCRLSGADFSRAEAALTAFNTVDLSGAMGLDTLRHERPSSIGVDTLERTAVGLHTAPERRGEVIAFLRAAGVPPRWLELSDGDAAAAVYVAYSLADRAFAHRLYRELQDRGVRCWLHEQPMLPGDGLDEGFDLGPRLFDRLVLCCSNASLTSWWLAAELDDAAARSRQLAEQGRPAEVLRPVNLGGAGSAEAWERTRARRDLSAAVADFTGWDRDDSLFEREIGRLVEALR